jgi:hypothetical protein
MKLFPTLVRQILVAATIFTTLPVSGADLNFKRLVSRVENRYQVRHEHIPLIAFASFCTRIITHGGVRGLRVADFENINKAIPADDFDSFVTAQLGDTWNVIVRTHEKSNNENTVIYARSDGSRFILLIASLENNELSLVKLGIDADSLPKWLNEHDHRTTM